eukprot:gene24961-10619_t
MALRQLGRTLNSFLASPSTLGGLSQLPVRNFGSAVAHDDHEEDTGPVVTPTVFDKLITLNVVDMQGHRHAVKAMVGKSLSQALIEHGFPETFFFPRLTFYTQHIVDCHVFLPHTAWNLVPSFEEKSEEAVAIKRMFRDIVQDYAKETSFFASFVDLTHEWDNMTIGIGPIRPWMLHTNYAFDGVHDIKTSQFSKPFVEIFG